MKRSPFSTPLLSWLWVILWSILIFLSVPVVRAIQKYIAEHWGKQFFLYLVFGSLFLGLIFLLYLLFFKMKIRSLANYAWLVVTLGLYIYFILNLNLRDAPDETIHFIEYGALGFFLFKGSLKRFGCRVRVNPFS